MPKGGQGQTSPWRWLATGNGVEREAEIVLPFAADGVELGQTELKIPALTETAIPPPGSGCCRSRTGVSQVTVDVEVDRHV